MPNIKMTGVGHASALTKIKKTNSQKEQAGERIMLLRQWRLGDIIMCEPISNYFFNHGKDVIFCTMNQYHPIVKSFRNPVKTMTYLNMKQREDMKIFTSSMINLNEVDLVHKGHVSKIDAFFTKSEIHEEILLEEKIPLINIHNQHLSWGKMLLKEKNIKEDIPIVAMIRTSFSQQSPRSIPINILDDVIEKISSEYQVVVIGEKPFTIPVNENTYNLTGCTPDIMSVAGILSQCKLLITVDTGLMHLAGAIRLPMVSVLGPTRPEDISSFYKYNTVLDYGRECSPCFDRGCNDICLKKVSSEEIMKYTIERIHEPFAPTEVIRLS